MLNKPKWVKGDPDSEIWPDYSPIDPRAMYTTELSEDTELVIFTSSYDPRVEDEPTLDQPKKTFHADRREYKDPHGMISAESYGYAPDWIKSLKQAKAYFLGYAACQEDMERKQREDVERSLYDPEESVDAENNVIHWEDRPPVLDRVCEIYGRVYRFEYVADMPHGHQIIMVSLMYVDSTRMMPGRFNQRAELAQMSTHPTTGKKRCAGFSTSLGTTPESIKSIDDAKAHFADIGMKIILSRVPTDRDGWICFTLNNLIWAETEEGSFTRETILPNGMKIIVSCGNSMGLWQGGLFAYRGDDGDTRAELLTTFSIDTEGKNLSQYEIRRRIAAALLAAIKDRKLE